MRQQQPEESAAAMAREELTEQKDDYNLAYIIHVLLGVSNLLPWNVFITAVDYFSYLYPGKHVDRSFAVAYMVSSLLVLLALIGTRNWSRRPNLRMRMNLGLCLFICCLLVVPVIDLAVSESGGKRPRGNYAVMLGTLVVCGLADGLVGGSLIGSTGELPKRYMQAVFVGTASSGVLVSFLRIITKASLPQTPDGLRKSTHLYFMVTISITLGCIVCYNILEKLPIIRHYRRRIPSPPKHASFKSKDLAVGLTNLRFESTEANEQPRFWDTWKRIKWSACGVCAIYIVTLSVFPGYITEDVSSEFYKDWYAILLIGTYNVADLVGKSLTAAYVPKGSKVAIWACFARTLFYPLFAACLHGPKFFQTEIPVIFLTCALGLTNGYLTSVLMILAPKAVRSTESETAGTVMLSFLGIGLAVGSVISWFWVI